LSVEYIKIFDIKQSNLEYESRKNIFDIAQQNIVAKILYIYYQTVIMDYILLFFHKNLYQELIIITTDFKD